MLLTRSVTIYRQWNYLRLWIGNSALLAYPEIAWIVYNDAPDDPCPPDLRARLASLNIQLVERTFNAGRSAARNFCARAAHSTWLEFIDGDDIPLPIDPDWLRTLAPEQLLHFPSRIYSLVDGTVTPDKELAPTLIMWWDLGVIRRLPMSDCRPACIIYPTAEFHELGGFDGRFDSREDLHLLWKFDQRGIGVTTATFAKQLYQRHDGSHDSEIVNISLHRLLRLAARHTPETMIASRLSARADTAAFGAIRSLHTDLTQNYARSGDREGSAMTDVIDLFRRHGKTLVQEMWFRAKRRFNWWIGR